FQALPALDFEMQGFIANMDAATKTLLSREQDMDLSSAIELEAFTQALLMTTEDHAEFYKAFTGKRPPEWKGR
ncbi:MAG: hypothetical protein IIC13_14075, partial [SAR324 cluster bacterium]|nr:hypothetical protein [SAR324 cluster bacterium]